MDEGFGVWDSDHGFRFRISGEGRREKEKGRMVRVWGFEFGTSEAVKLVLRSPKSASSWVAPANTANPAGAVCQRFLMFFEYTLYIHVFLVHVVYLVIYDSG